ncbi:AI-2E family transporter [bacterium]|nr:AI-2E family transporter [bacterium]
MADNEDKERQDSLVIVQRRLVITCLTLLICILLFKLAEVFSDILHILAVSVFLTYTVISLVDFLDSKFKNRMLAVTGVYFLGAVFTLVGIVLVIPTILFQLSQLIELTIKELPSLLQNSGAYLKPLETTLAKYDIHVGTDEMVSLLVSRLPQPDGSAIVAQMSGVAISTMTLAVYGLSVLLLTFYFLLDGKGMIESVVRLSPSKYQHTVTEALSEIHRCLNAFFRGQIALGLLFGVFMVVVYMLLGVEYALALGLFLGIWEIVPVIGPTIGFVPALVSVLFLGMANVGGNRLMEILVLVLVFNICQWVKDNLVAPRYIGDAIGLHPVLVFIAIMIGARLDGILGIIVSLPVAGTLAVLFKYLNASRQRSEEEPTNTSESEAVPLPEPEAQ